jgi:transcriptional regulator with XRE-family HTH domain
MGGVFMGFQTRLKDLREAQGWTYSKLAYMVDKSEGAIRSWETGRSQPDFEMLVTLSNLFDCSIDYMLGVSEFKNKEAKEEIVSAVDYLGHIISKQKNSKEVLDYLARLIEVIAKKDNEKDNHPFFQFIDDILPPILSIHELEKEFDATKTFDVTRFINRFLDFATVTDNIIKSLHEMSAVQLYSLAGKVNLYGQQHEIDLVHRIFDDYKNRQAP